ARGLRARWVEAALAFALRLGELPLPLLDDPAGLLDLLRDRRPHLVEDVVDLLAVDPDLVGQRNRLRVVHEVVELVDENEYVHGAVSVLATLPGSRGVPAGRSGGAPGSGARPPRAPARPRFRPTPRSPSP